MQDRQQSLVNVICPHSNDVLCGRGKCAMHWNGNRFFKALVEGEKAKYLTVDNDTRNLIAKNIIKTVRAQNPPGRFLKLDERTNKWNDIRKRKTLRKTRQALRDIATSSTSSCVESSNNGSQQRSIASSNHNLETIEDLDIDTETSFQDTVKEEIAIENYTPNYSDHTYGPYSHVADLFFMDEVVNLSSFDPKDVFSSEM